MARRGRERARIGSRIGALAVLTIVMILAPMLMAGTTAPTVVAIVFAAPFAAIAAQLAYQKQAPDIRHPVIIAALVASATVTLQALPLPIWLVATWYPDAAQLTRSAAAALDAPEPAFASISLAPLGTRRELAEGLAVLSVMVAAWAASRANDRIWVVRAGATSTVLIGVVSLLHTILDVRQPFGFVAEPHWRTAFIGPILNQNMLGGVLAAGVPLALACGLASERRDARLPWLFAAAGLALMASFCGSRGAIMSLGVGVMVFVALWLRREDLMRSARTRVAMLVGTGLIGIASLTAVSLVAGPMVAETTRGLPKLEMFRQSLDLIPSAPWTGVGRGAYAAAFVRAHGGLERPEHPENLLIEWIVELGMPLALAVITCLVVALVRAARTARSPAQLGAIAAVASLVAHDQFDFALEMVGIAVLGAGIFGAAVAPSSTAREERGAPNRARLAPASVGALALVVAAMIAEPTIELAVPRLRDELLDGIRERDWDRVRESTTVAIAAHPSEPVFPLLAGHASLLQDRDDTLLWLNRAMLLAPWWYEPHHLAARWLARRGAIEQAWLEVREVRRIEPARAHTAACAVAARPGASAAALRVLRDDRELLDAIVRCAPTRDGAAIDAALADTGHPDALLRRARAAIAGGRASDSLAILDTLDINDEAVLLARADALSAVGRPADALAELQARAQDRSSRQILVRLARVQADLGDAAAMRATLDDVLALSDGTPAALAAQRLLLAELEEVAGHPALAMRALQEAHGADPQGQALRRILALASRSGDEHRAGLARAELCRREGTGSPHCATPARFERHVVPAQLPASP